MPTIATNTDTLKHIAFACSLAFCLYAFIATPEAPVAPPSGDLATLLTKAGKQDKDVLFSLYDALAKRAAIDAGKDITTTGMWRAVYMDSLRKAVPSDMVGKYPGLDVAVDKEIGKHLTLDNTAIDTVIQAKIVRAMEAVRDQCR
jgi:hypothetical protein